MTLPPIFRGRRILVISPQPWDHLPVSKHHYAEHLGQANEVLFLSPHDPRLRSGDVERRATGTPGVDEIRWMPRVPRRLRFHAPALYGFLIAREVRRLVDRIGGSPDLVWCFDFNSYPDLKAFGARQAIFHPVDPLSSPRQARIAATADLVLSVSPEILASVTRHVPDTPAAVIPHGIGSAFLDLAVSPATPAPMSRQCGYFGNLDRPILDVPLIAEIVAENPEISFNFWGPYSPDGAFARCVGGCSNAVLHGSASKPELAARARDMDAFLMAYREHDTESDLSNAHKIFEYFATGRVVVSTYMSCHSEAEDLLVRTEPGRSEAFPSLFASVMGDLGTHNAPERMARRKALAAGHGYGTLLERIAEVLSAISAPLHEGTQS